VPPNDPAREGLRLHPQRDRRVRCSALGRCSITAIILCDFAIFIDCDHPKSSRRGGKPPNGNAPTRAIALRCLELRLIDPCVVRGDCLTGNLDNARLLRRQRSVDLNSRPWLRAGRQEGKECSDECSAHKRPNVLIYNRRFVHQNGRMNRADRVRRLAEAIRRKRFAFAAETHYCAWLRRYCDYLDRLPSHLPGELKLERFFDRSRNQRCSREHPKSSR
jgi:hypothetical protein